MKPAHTKFGDRVSVGGLREDAPERLSVPKSAKFDCPPAPWRPAQRIQPLSELRQHRNGDAASEFFAGYRAG